MSKPHRLKRVLAADVHANQIIEWMDKRCRVIRITRTPPAAGHRHARRYSKRPGVILHVMPLEPWAEPLDLHWWNDEEVTICGWSFGDPSQGGTWS